MEFGRTRKRLDYELYEDEFTRGVQMVVEVSGRRALTIAEGDDGTGRPLYTDGIHMRPYYVRKSVTFLDEAMKRR